MSPIRKEDRGTGGILQVVGAGPAVPADDGVEGAGRDGVEDLEDQAEEAVVIDGAGVSEGGAYQWMRGRSLPEAG